MISENWFMQIESTIYTHLQYQLAGRNDAPFPNLNCTTSSQNESLEDVSDFPTIYIHMLPPLEIGNDLYNDTIAGLNVTFELQVFSDKSESQCRKIITAAILEMKKLRFNVSMFPDPQTENKKYYAIARFNRVVGAADQDIVPNE